MKYIFLIFVVFTYSHYLAAQEKICEVSLMRGEVKILLANGKTEELTKETAIFEGASITTGESSFVKLVFIDKSLMTLGSNSTVKITAFTKESPGIIALVRGEIRAQVTKDYMEMEDKNKSKLFIRTKTAALGIRGTDFQVGFTAKREETTLMTFEGKVAMNKIDSGMRNHDLNQRDLDTILERKDRVFVTRGEISNINRDTLRVGPPQRMDTRVMESFMKSEIPRERMMERGPKNPQGENQKENPNRKDEKPGERPEGGSDDGPKDRGAKNGQKNGPGEGPENGNQNGGPGGGPGGNQGGPGGGPGGNQGGPGGAPGGNQGSPSGGPGGNQGSSNSGPGGGPGGNQSGPDRSRGQQQEGRREAGNNMPKDDRRNQQASPPPPR